MERSARRAFLWAYAVWLMGIVTFFVPAATWSPASRFGLTRAVVENHTLSIDAFVASTGDRSRRAAHWYTDKAPLPSLIAVVPYAVVHLFHRARGLSPRFHAIETPSIPAKRVVVNRPFQQALYICSIATAGIAGAVVAVALFELLRRRGSPTSALVGSELAVLGTPLLPYATSFYGHEVAAACLVCAVMLLDDASPESGRRARAVRFAGACLAAAPGNEYLTAVPAVLIGAWFLLRLERRRVAAALFDLSLGALGPLFVIGVYHAICFGAPWKTGYSFIARPEFAAGHALGLLGVRLPSWEALWGLSFGTRRGLFYIAPIALVGLGGLGVAAVRDKDPAARIGLVAFGSMLWLNAGYYMWWGGAAAGPRHLVPALAFLGLGIARAWRTRWLRIPILLLGAVSVANVVVITAVGLEAPDFDDILRRYAWPAFLHGQVARLSGASNVGLKLGLRSLASLLPLAAWFGFGQVYVARLLRTDPEESGVPSSIGRALLRPISVRPHAATPQVRHEAPR
jgi:hypothetical protein